jgi:hypothetical protein
MIINKYQFKKILKNKKNNLKFLLHNFCHKLRHNKIKYNNLMKLKKILIINYQINYSHNNN